MSKPTDGKYGEITCTGKQFHPGEPLFILRAQDPLAPKAIMDYAELCARTGCSTEHVEACRFHATRLLEWQKQNPGLVKRLPD